MVGIPLISERPDIGVRIHGLLDNRLVHAPAVALLPAGLHELLAGRALRMSSDGRAAAEVVRGNGNEVRIAFSDPSVRMPDVTFADSVRILHAGLARVRVWGEREGVRGVWQLSHDNVRLVSRFPSVGGYLRTPFGDAPVSKPTGGRVQYLFGDAVVEVPLGSEFLFGDNGRADAVVMPITEGPNRQWVLSQFNWPKADVVGPSLFPLALSGTHVIPFYADGRVQYAVRHPNGDYLCDSGYAEPLFDRNGEGGLDAVWSSPKNIQVAILRGARGLNRQLLIGSDETGWVPAFEGRFFMEKDGLRWSSSGREFVAHVKMLDTDGNQTQGQLLVTRRFAIQHPHKIMVVDPRIDDEGRLTYIRVGDNGRQLIAGRNVSDPFLFAWNTTIAGGIAAANVLVRGAIHRIELPFGR